MFIQTCATSIHFVSCPQFDCLHLGRTSPPKYHGICDSLVFKAWNPQVSSFQLWKKNPTISPDLLMKQVGDLLRLSTFQCSTCASAKPVTIQNMVVLLSLSLYISLSFPLFIYVHLCIYRARQKKQQTCLRDWISFIGKAASENLQHQELSVTGLDLLTVLAIEQSATWPCLGSEEIAG